MDQDLALMKQLLTLNEQIEEMKWRRKLGGYLHPSHFSQSSSSCYLPGSFSYSSFASSSAFAVNEPRLKYPSPSDLSLLDSMGPYSTQESLRGWRNLDEDSRKPGVVSGPNNAKCSKSKLAGPVSTSDLGSSGDDEGSASDLNRSHHNDNGDTMINKLDNDGYFSMEKPHSTRSAQIYEENLTEKTDNSLQGSSQSRCTSQKGQSSTDSGIQDEALKSELLI